MIPAPPQDSHLASARLALAIAVACVSTGAIFARLADSPAVATAAWRMTLATALILPVLWRRWPELRALPRRDLALGAAAGLCLALHFATWISSLEHTTVASSVVLVNTTPLWVAFLSPFITGEQTSRRDWMGIALSFAGATLIAGNDFQVGGQAWWGDVLALFGGVSAAVYLLLGRQLRARLSLPSYCAVTYGTSTAILWLFVVVAGAAASGFSSKTWAALTGMAVVAQIGGHTLYNWSLKHLSTSAVSVALLGEPILSALLAWRLFGEVLSLASAAGAVLVLCGIYLVGTRRR